MNTNFSQLLLLWEKENTDWARINFTSYAATLSVQEDFDFSNCQILLVGSLFLWSLIKGKSEASYTSTYVCMYILGNPPKRRDGIFGNRDVVSDELAPISVNYINTRFQRCMFCLHSGSVTSYKKRSFHIADVSQPGVYNLVSRWLLHFCSIYGDSSERFLQLGKSKIRLFHRSPTRSWRATSICKQLAM